MARLADMVAALLMLFLLAPALGLIALLVRMSSPGPPIVRIPIRRNDGRVIGICRFRTTDVESSEVTATGRILQESSLDALPALINIVRGDISLSDFGHFL